MISVIIPTFNEVKNQYIQNIFPLLKNTNNIEVICVDSYSQDGTVELIKRHGFKLLSCDTTSRAYRLNLGIKNAKGEMILLHHPRSLLSVHALAVLKNEINELYWGGFTHRFDKKHPCLSFTSFWSNRIRADYRGIFYLDHCLFVKKEIFDKVGLMPDIDIFEDTELSKKLLSYCPPIRLDDISLTSATRFLKNGILKQALLNQILKVKYFFNFDHQEMNKIYEKNTSLNANYQGRSTKTKVKNKN